MLNNNGYLDNTRVHRHLRKRHPVLKRRWWFQSDRVIRNEWKSDVYHYYITSSGSLLTNHICTIGSTDTWQYRESFSKRCAKIIVTPSKDMDISLRCAMPVGLLPGHVLFLKVHTACVNCTYSVHREVLHFHYFIFLVAVPMLHWFTLVANLSELRVSPMHSSLGLILTNIKVLELPPRLFCSRWVSLEFR